MEMAGKQFSPFMEQLVQLRLTACATASYSLWKWQFSIPSLTLQPHPPRLYPELIAFFDLKSQNKKGVLRLTNMSYTMSLLSIIHPIEIKLAPI
jgi:hypothetical protein